MNSESIAVIIPCYNEALTIGKVIDDFHRELPQATVYVYDNNSSDDTSRIATEHGATVRFEPRQGKGNVCRQMFRDIDADCYLMVDGDDTYPAEAAKALCEPILNGTADMTVGDRLSNGTYAEENKRAFHGFGNNLVRAMIRWIYGYSFDDVMTGYRAMSRPFVKTFPVLSEGFQIETELSIHAVDHRWRIKDVPIEYRDRPEGSESKLNTVSDGIKVVAMIGTLFKDYRPLKFFSLVALLFAGNKRRIGIDKKIELHFAAINMAVVIHDDGLDAAANHLANNLSYSNRFSHLASTATGKDLNDREENNLQVRDGTAFGDVLEITSNHAVEVGIVAVRDLPPAGDPGLNRQTLQVEFCILGHLVGQRRARAHDGHLAQEHVHELRELVDGVLTDELADLGDARVFLHLEHGAGDLVSLLELGEALVGVPVHGAELPHAEGGQAAVGAGLANADLAVERAALALQADGGGKHQTRHGNDGQHAAAEHDVERALDGAVGQARVVPVHDGLHSLIAADALTLAHSLCNQRRPRGRITLCHFFISSHDRTYVPVPRNPPRP